MRREPIFHRPELGTARADFEAQTAPDFWEVGASGRRYSREEVLDALEARHAQPHDDEWETSDFHCREIGPDSYAVTYVLRQGERITRRLTCGGGTTTAGRSSTTRARSQTDSALTASSVSSAVAGGARTGASRLALM